MRYISAICILSMVVFATGLGGVGDRVFLSTAQPVQTQDKALPSVPATEAGAVTLILDDGVNEQNIGIGGGQWIWLNRFTPDALEFPFDLESVEVYWNGLYASVGETYDVYVYEDTDGDGDPATGAVHVGSLIGADVQVVDGFSSHEIGPIAMNGPNDVLIAIVNRNVGLTVDDFPLALDNTDPQVRTYVGVDDGDPADPPVLPSGSLWGEIGAFGLPGNALVRGYGTTTGGKGCEFAMKLGEDSYRQGEVVGFDISIHHRREATVTVPINSWVVDSDRRIVTSTTSKPLTISQGDFLTLDLSISLPPYLSPGRYYLMSSIGEMKQGTASARQPFLVKSGVSDQLGGSTQLEGVPEVMALGENYPNPFNPSTTISYGVSEDSWVSIRIYNSIGQEVATLVDDYQSAGFRTVVWHGTDNTGSSVASGIYLYRMATQDYVETKKLLLMK